MFFDLNIGMFPYIPMLLLIYFALLARDLFSRRRLSLNLQLFLVMIIMMLMCTMTTNWNHGASGPTRYVIWMLPIILFSVVNEEALKHISGVPKYGFALVLWINIALQSILLFGYGGMNPSSSCYLYHTPLAKYILRNLPCFYNPSHEIFAERTLHHEDIKETPVAYTFGGKCKKALARGKDREKLIALCDYIPERYLGFFAEKENEDQSAYVNY
jgi:hypothetical protein